MPKPHPSREQDKFAVLRARILKAPDGPGVYRWLSKEGHVLYVGKAKSLRKRLASYVQDPKPSDGPWRQLFLSQIADFDVTITNTELEALVLESNLIKQLKPRFNVLLKDDKNYVYIRISVQDSFPRIDVVRRIEDDGARYFGPRLSAYEARQELDILRKVYPFRTCRMEIALKEEKDAEEGHEEEEIRKKGSMPVDVVCTHKDRPTPCLDHHIGQCSAPCVGNRTPQAYRTESIDGVIEFLKGNREPVRSLLADKMKTAAAEKKFEIAAQLRNALQMLEEKGGDDVALVSDPAGDDVDVIGIAVLSQRSHVVVLHRRGGKIIGEREIVLSGQGENEEEVLEQFLPQFYGEDSDIPPVILVSRVLSSQAIVEQLLTERRDKKVKILVPERGKKSQLLDLAMKNAQQKAKSAEAKWEADKRNTEEALAELQVLLSLEKLPERIEGYDISHLGGTETVGSMVVMKHGKGANDQYRSFTIRTLKKGEVDDYWSLKEVLSRRLRRLVESIPEEEQKWKEQGVTFGHPKKSEKTRVQELLKTEEDVALDAFLIARHESSIVAMVELHEHSAMMRELKNLWVSDEWSQTPLLLFLIRKLLKSVKKGKVYTVIDPALENTYARLGFRYVIEPPKQVSTGLNLITSGEHIVMLWEALLNKPDASFGARPDLLVIDGGKGQLSAVMDVLRNTELSIPVIGLAKREEEVFVPDQSDPILFPKDSPAKFLLMRLRDEAHRSANRHREKRVSKAMLRSDRETHETEESKESKESEE